MDGTQRKHIAAAIERERVSAIIRTNGRALASDAMKAAVDGGFRVVEFTLTTPGALDLISAFRTNQDLLVGAGTVLTTSQAQEAVSAGAQFLVSPVVDVEVIAKAAALDVVSIPGAYTPTEMQTAHRASADFVKVFPATAGGVGFIEAIRGPLPHLRLFPTAGVTVENFTAFLDAGCVGVGFVGPLFEPDDLAGGDFAAVQGRAEEVIRRVEGWRASRRAGTGLGRTVQ
ncbi:MAG: bifunctional 4-hydroxy-2-oxoglutarate aldolase/2-dehydro-3-deoxy-phosphogluconate aldolase [Phycisphaerae bacterium]|jgi:Entner-Doudoroff aldolase